MTPPWTGCTRPCEHRAEVLGVEAIGFVADAMDVMRSIRAGQLDEAEQAAERCFARGSAVGDADALAWYGGQLVVIRWLQGRSLEVLSLVEAMTASPTLAETNVVYIAAAACVGAACGEVDRARAALDRLVARGLASIPETSNWLMTMFIIADAARVLEDAEAARLTYELLSPYAELPAMGSLAVVCLGSTHRALGIAALTFGDVELAVGHLQAAVAANRRLANRPMATIAAHRSRRQPAPPGRPRRSRAGGAVAPRCGVRGAGDGHAAQRRPMERPG